MTGVSFQCLLGQGEKVTGPIVEFSIDQYRFHQCTYRPILIPELACFEQIQPNLFQKSRDGQMHTPATRPPSK